MKLKIPNGLENVMPAIGVVICFLLILFISTMALELIDRFSKSPPKPPQITNVEVIRR